MRRPGFTLIELLMVIVILGILTAIAMPKLGKTRERGYFKAVSSDLRNLQTQQEIYYSVPMHSIYANNISGLTNFKTSPGVDVVITEAGQTGWAATATHTGLNTNQMCAVYNGAPSAPPAPATVAGVVTCTGE
jgi:type IV pilus assembly protein PilA